MNQQSPTMGLRADLLANALIVAPLLFAAIFAGQDPAFYYRSVQEDGAVEWGTFWAFALAAAAYGVATVRLRRAGVALPWFSLGLALFCFVVAMEEISWGQRILGFGSPEYFLANNYQQEVNLHNVLDTDTRQLAFQGLAAAYGLALPLLALVPALRSLMQRLGVLWPPASLAPGFGAALVIYAVYPWTHTGEVVELCLGLGFVFAAVLRAVELRGTPPVPGRLRSVAAVTLTALLVAGLGGASAAASRNAHASDPAVVETARLEIEALRRDLDAKTRQRRGVLHPRCGTHKRLYGYVLQNGGDFFRTGEFVDLIDRGMPETRADFLIDPWGSPYWLRFECSEDGGRQVLFLYSFGPNRLRDSSEWEIRGDDVGVYVLRKGMDDEDTPPTGPSS